MSPSVPLAVTSGWRVVHRFRTALLAMCALVVCAIAPAAASAAISPTNDPFYVAPANLSSFANGAVIRSRSTAFHATPLFKLDYKVYQVLYRSNDISGQPNATVATIILPTHRPATGRRLVSYQTAYDGIGPLCRPSYSLQGGTVALQAVETLLIRAALSRGWTVVTSDYEGPKDEFGVGLTSGWGVLDGIRAAENFAPAGLTDGAKTPVGMLGYSGGGQATAWAAEQAKSYAPELNIVGATQGGVGGNLSNVLDAFDGQLYAGVGIAGLIGISNAYPDVNLDGQLSNHGRAIFKAMRKTGQCITDYAFKYPFVKFRTMFINPGLIKTPAIQAIAQANSLGKNPPTTFPVLWYGTVTDEMNTYKPNLAIAKAYCAAGTKLDYRISRTEEHAMQAFSWPFKAQEWLSLRFNGAPVPDNCGTF